MDAPLAELNAALAGRTYIAGGARPSLADLVLYAAVSPAAVAFPVAQHGHFCNLLRFYDLLHHTADAQRLFPAASFERPRYVAPPPPPPPEPKAAKGGDKGGDKAAGKAAGKAAAEPVPSSSGGDAKAGGKQAAPEAPAAAAADAGGKADKKKVRACACLDRPWLCLALQVAPGALRLPHRCLPACCSRPPSAAARCACSRCAAGEEGEGGGAGHPRGVSGGERGGGGRRRRLHRRPAGHPGGADCQGGRAGGTVLPGTAVLPILPGAAICGAAAAGTQSSATRRSSAHTRQHPP